MRKTKQTKIKQGIMSILKNRCDKCSRYILRAIVWFWVFVFIIVPSALYIHPPLLRRAVFINYFSGNFTDFEFYGRSPYNTRNFYLINKATNKKLGVWHTLPDSDILQEKSPNDSEFMKKLSNGKNVFLYMHGNSFHRAASFMLQLYKVLNRLDNHVIALDYRGYGDSEGYPETENDLVEDAITVLNFIKKHAHSSRIYFWGHSLGTGVASSLIAALNKSDVTKSIKGTVLEAPFTTMREAGQNHPHGYVYRYLPYFDSVFLDGFSKNGLYFENSKNLIKAPSPILILHCEDDGIVPISVGEKLYRGLKKAGKEVIFRRFPAGYGYYHSRLSNAFDLPEVIREFLKFTEKY